MGLTVGFAVVEKVELAELIVYAGALPEDERSRIEKELGEKYGIKIGPRPK